ncbi:MAG: cobalt ECF transporter T component CbiQ [Actinomycetota bacterium]|nr:cobalt ECF transporter T component CbiQ [Actinomycetota bacterium]
MKGSFEQISDDSVAAGSRLGGLDVRLKAGVAFVLFLTILNSNRPVLPVLLWALSVTVISALGHRRRLIFERLSASLVLVMMIIILQALLIGKTPILAFKIGGLGVVFKREGLLIGLLIGSRTLGATAVLIAFSLMTPAYELFSLLDWCRLPKIFTEIAMLLYRYVFVLFEEAKDTRAAQSLRLGYVGYKNALSSTSRLIGIVFVNSFEQSLRTHEAMMARGYSGEYHFEPLGKLSPKSFALLVGSSILILSIFKFLEGNLQ